MPGVSTSSLLGPKNGASASDPRVKISYYRYEAIDGAVSLLAFCANTSKEEIKDISFKLQESAPLTHWDDLTQGGAFPGTLSLKPYEYRILFIR